MNTFYNDCLSMIECAIKAPSGHNTQPWLFKINENSINIYPNWQEVLPIVDPNNRELFISIGAALENLGIKANALGYEMISSFDSITKVITANLNKNNNRIDSPLLDVIDIRQTNRKKYTGRPIDKESLVTLQNVNLEDGISIFLISKNNPDFEILTTYIEEGNNLQMSNKLFKKELIKYIKFNNIDIKNNPVGLTYKVVEAPALPRLVGKSIMKFFLTPRKQNKSDLGKIASSSHLVLFTTRNNSENEWINLGRSLQRFILTVTDLKIAHAYMNQPCEVHSISTEVQNGFPIIKGTYPTLLLRLGYAALANYSPRKKLKDVLI